MKMFKSTNSNQDANENVSKVINSLGGVAAHYEYDPFGNVVIATGALASENEFQFSTKYFDNETELLYYGYRYYSADLGRWINRDPIGEQGGFNLFAAMFNNPINMIDTDGRFVRAGLAPRIGSMGSPKPTPSPSPSPSPNPGPFPPIGPPSSNDRGYKCLPCNPPAGSRHCHYALPGSRKRGKHRKGAGCDQGHCKFWVINQDPITCRCFKNFDGQDDKCEKCPSGTSETGKAGPNVSGGGKTPTFPNIA